MPTAQSRESDGALGVDAAKVAAWMTTLPIAMETPIAFELAGQGKSNITLIAIDSAGQRWILRRPPLGDLLPTAHDVLREHRILSALERTTVPAPRPIALTVDESVTDAPLVVMEHVDGLVLDDIAKAEALPEAIRRSVGLALVDVLAAVHAVDLGDAGLNDLASHRPYAGRQLKRWQQQWIESRTRDEPRLDDLTERLAAAVPEQAEVVLVHGDYHMRNVIVDGSTGHIRALLDWELSTLGDPIADLGLLLAYWPEPGDPPGQAHLASALPGFPRRADLAEHYAQVTGRDTSTVGFWEVLGLWKVAVILEGISRRALEDPRNAERGATGDGSMFDAILSRARARATAIGI